MRTLSFWMAFVLWCAGEAAAKEKVVLIVHGGSADKEDRSIPPDQLKLYRAGLEAAAKAGYEVLKQKGSSLDAVEASIRVLEDDPMFNAGRGAVFTHEGKNELDASVMDGKTLSAGAVASVTTIKNPISAARAVMEKTKHVMLVSQGAEKFAKEVGLERVDPSYFRTENQWKALQNALAKEKTQGSSRFDYPRSRHWGTVGAVALDASGNLAAGTSTGGLTNKRFGRVGDSSIIGAGTYADNQGVAVSCTGIGEFFIRYSVAHDVNALHKYKKVSIQKAADEVVRGKLKPVGGEGALIGLDAKGNSAVTWNTEGVFRAVVTESGKTEVVLFD